MKNIDYCDSSQLKSCNSEHKNLLLLQKLNKPEFTNKVNHMASLAKHRNEANEQEGNLALITLHLLACNTFNPYWLYKKSGDADKSSYFYSSDDYFQFIFLTLIEILQRYDEKYNFENFFNKSIKCCLLDKHRSICQKDKAFLYCDELENIPITLHCNANLVSYLQYSCVENDDLNSQLIKMLSNVKNGDVLKYYYLECQKGTINDVAIKFKVSFKVARNLILSAKNNFRQKYPDFYDLYFCEYTVA